MAWTWRYLDAEGSETRGPQLTFPDQAEAEAWLGETWSMLLESGVDSVTLLEDERVVYGPMGLGAV